MPCVFRTRLCVQNEARKLNHQEMVAEDQRKKQPANYEAKRQHVDWELEEEEKRKVGRTDTLQYGAPNTTKCSRIFYTYILYILSE